MEKQGCNKYREVDTKKLFDTIEKNRTKRRGIVMDVEKRKLVWGGYIMGLTYQSIGDMAGVSRQRVHQLLTEIKEVANELM